MFQEPAHWNATSSGARTNSAPAGLSTTSATAWIARVGNPRMRHRCGQRFDAAHPLLAVVVTVAEEVFDQHRRGCGSGRRPEVTATPTTRMPPNISDTSATVPHSAPPRRKISPVTARPSRKTPDRTRVALWNTTSRETWISTAQRRLRAAAMAISGAAIAVTGARAANSAMRDAVEQQRRRSRARGHRRTGRRARRRAD